MADFGLKIKKQEIAKDVEDCVPKELIFSSSYACAKILQDGKQDAATGNPVEILLDDNISFPIQILCFLYDSNTQEYEPIDVEFDADKIYLPATAKNEGSYYYFFICYA